VRSRLIVIGLGPYPADPISGRGRTGSTSGAYDRTETAASGTRWVHPDGRPGEHSGRRRSPRDSRNPRLPTGWALNRRH